MTQVKCPCCLTKQDPREPNGGWEGEQNDVKCRFCTYEFTVICEVTYEVHGDFDLFSFMDLFDLKNLPDGIARDIFHYQRVRRMYEKKKPEVKTE